MPLKPLQESDLSLILPWRNAPSVRQAMYTHHEITQEEHYTWFNRIKNDPSIRYFLWLDREGSPQGVVNYSAIDLTQRAAFWGFYARPLAGLGTGMRMELEALEKAFGEFGIFKLNCEVLESNKAVVNMHKKVGFIEEGCFRQQHFDGVRRIDVIRLSMLADEWPEARNRLSTRVSTLNLESGKRD